MKEECRVFGQGQPLLTIPGLTMTALLPPLHIAAPRFTQYGLTTGAPRVTQYQRAISPQYRRTPALQYKISLAPLYLRSPALQIVPPKIGEIVDRNTWTGRAHSEYYERNSHFQ